MILSFPGGQDEITGVLIRGRRSERREDAMWLALKMEGGAVSPGGLQKLKKAKSGFSPGACRSAALQTRSRLDLQKEKRINVCCSKPLTL